MIRFEVVDTGQGFTDAEAKYLFKRFSQIDASSTRQHGGTGLGLAISMQFVELHGGRMDARSAPGKGSTFFFTIKFGLPTADDYPKPQVSTPGTPAFETPLSTIRRPRRPTGATPRCRCLHFRPSPLLSRSLFSRRTPGMHKSSACQVCLLRRVNLPDLQRSACQLLSDRVTRPLSRLEARTIH